MAHVHGESDRESAAAECADAFEEVTAAEAALVRGGVKQGPGGCIPDRTIEIPELSPPPRLFVPSSWWLRPSERRRMTD
jgi:hypothetical protein